MGGLGKACRRGRTGGSEWPCAVNRSRALAVLGRGGEDERQDGTSRRFRVRLDVGVAAREDKWDGRSGSGWVLADQCTGGGDANGRRKVELLVESVVRTGALGPYVYSIDSCDIFLKELC